jgi:hypothetical protein
MLGYRKIFVVGCPRSGTDWISKLIGNHPEVLGAGTESHAYPFVFEPFRHLQSKKISQRLRNPFRTIAADVWNCLFRGISEKAVWNQIIEEYQGRVGDLVGLHHFVSFDELTGIIAEVRHPANGMDALVRAQEAIRKIFDVFWKQHRTTESVFVEKTPLHIRYVPQILNTFPESVVVEVVRDGRDVDVSRSALSKNPSQSWARATTDEKIKLWIECIELGNRLLDDTDFAKRVLRVRYEGMRREPNARLRQVFDFCQLEHTEAQISEILQDLDINNVKGRGDGHYVRSGIVGQWQDELSKEAIDLWDLKAGGILNSLGYSSNTQSR